MIEVTQEQYDELVRTLANDMSRGYPDTERVVMKEVVIFSLMKTVSVRG